MADAVGILWWPVYQCYFDGRRVLDRPDLLQRHGCSKLPWRIGDLIFEPATVTKSLLIANRGEIACRVIRSAKQLGLRTVAVFSDVDKNALHRMLADESVHIGGPKPADSYLNIDAILSAARDGGCSAIHPGYGFLAENADFAIRVKKAGLIWVGPSPGDITAMGDKQRARALAEAAGVPVSPGSQRLLTGDFAGLEGAASSIGYPLLVKASAGGGGIGMRLVEEVGQLIDVATATATMAERAFGDGTIYLEKYIANARHIEIQIFGYGDGNAVHLFERECYIQRRFQKVIEESPATGVDASSRAAMARAAVALVAKQSYDGVGTVEFILDVDSGDFYFLEMNTRIQVEHPVTEMTTGIDLVEMQLRHALGDRTIVLEQAQIKHFGHAIECRIYAENPSKMFLPSPGVISRMSLPGVDDDVRIDAGVREGDTVTPYYDPTLAKLICRGTTRSTALAKVSSSLNAVAIEGISTNIDFLQRVVEHPEFKAGRITTAFVEAHLDDLI